MAEGTKAILSALDTAKIQHYHYTAIGFTGMGFFAGAYNLFCITAVTKLLGRLYYYNPAHATTPGKLPEKINNTITGVALCGSLVGQLFFGWLGDKLGRKKVYEITLVIMMVCAIASGLSFRSRKEVVLANLCFFRFWLGLSIGATYPLSAVIMSEYSNQDNRGALIAAVFAMQGIGILFAGVVSTVVSKTFMYMFKAAPFSENHVLSTQPQADYAWRIVLMFGAIPAALTFLWSKEMPETARYTALVEGNHKKAAADMAKLLENDVNYVEDGSGKTSISKNSYGLYSSHFIKRHGIHLLGTASTWGLLDITYYTLQLRLNDIYPASGLINKASTMNALEEMYQVSVAMTIIALVATVPGYWLTVFLIDKIGRYIIQLTGFFLMSICMTILGFEYGNLRGEKSKCGPTSKKDFCDGNLMMFISLFSITLFWANFGPNSTTFILPAELFPARFRSTCHGVSAAAGKIGAIIGAFVVQSYLLDGNSHDIKKAMIGLAVLNLIGFFFSFLVPETKDRSLEEISGEDRELERLANQKGSVEIVTS